MTRSSFSMLSALLCISPLCVAQSQQYFITTIPVPPDAASILSVVGLDANGHPVGNVLKGKQEIPVHWFGSTARVLPNTGTGAHADGLPYFASSVTANGGAAGMGINNSGASDGVYWDPSGRPWELIGASAVSGVSDNGMVTGTIYGANLSSTSAAIWKDHVSGKATLLPLPQDPNCVPNPELCYSQAYGISPNGRYVLGSTSSVYMQADRGRLWIDGVLAESYGGSAWYASAVNNSGVVVGNYNTNLPPFDPYGYGITHAFKWQAGTLTDLGTLPGGTAGNGFYSNANAINASGIVVGSSQAASSAVTHAVMWAADGKMTDLTKLLAPWLPADTVAFDARAITDSGQIQLNAYNTKTNADSFLIATPAIATRISISSNINPSVFGQQIHLVASVIPASGAKPTGSVTWYDNGKLLGTARMTQIGTASWEPSTWSAGLHNVTASYAGVAPNGGGTSAVFKQTVTASSTRTTLMSSVNPATHGTAFKLTATVVPSSGTISGSVTFKSGSATLGTAAVDARTKQACLTITLKTAGKYTLSAVYPGTNDFKGSASSVLTLTVK